LILDKTASEAPAGVPIERRRKYTAAHARPTAGSNFMPMIPTNTVIVAALLIALVIGAVAWFVMQKQRSLKLKQRFGPEYDLTVSEFRPRIRPDSF
jgi:hypothetical protein